MYTGTSFSGQLIEDDDKSNGQDFSVVSQEVSINLNARDGLIINERVDFICVFIVTIIACAVTLVLAENSPIKLLSIINSVLYRNK